jgi:hypothetical protein
MLNSTKIIVGVVASLFIQTTVYAEEHHEGREGDRHEHRSVREGNRNAHHEGWHGDIRHFHDRDIELWRGGRWIHGRHGGHFAWWWIAGGVWYLYPSPVYPYPDPYLPPVMIEQQPPVAVTPSNPASTEPVQYWYHCTNPEGYYPYVPQCLTDWEKVPASPPPQ